jgi:A/G-specific adenine glycosylase
VSVHRSTRSNGSDASRSAGPALLAWFSEHRRPLPWRRSRDPYRIWLAEVLLQQTRVDQAVPYYERLVRAFPTVRALADAPIDRVLKLWQGAGYYARAHRLHAAARTIVREHGGRIPSTVEELEGLPGVGPYIARAVASLAFDVPVVALEANGLRVAARWTLERGDLGSPRVRHRLATALAARRPAGSAGPFNEAVMELGETVCRPVVPDCDACPVSRWCRAFRELEDPGTVPRARRGRSRPHVHGAVVVLTRRGRWLVQRRAPGDLLGGLWEFPGGRIEPGERPEAAARRELTEETGLTAGRLRARGVVRHAYSHFTVELHVFEGSYDGDPRAGVGPDRRWVRPAELRALPIPKATEKVVERLATGTASPD